MTLSSFSNIYSGIAQNNWYAATSVLSSSIERLSSGLRINYAMDDASGLAIASRFRAQINGFSRAALNAQDAMSYMQVAEGGMEVIGDMVQRMRELSVQAGNGIYTANDRKLIQNEISQLGAEIDRISTTTEFNTKKVFHGGYAERLLGGNYGFRHAMADGSSLISIHGVKNIWETQVGANEGQIIGLPYGRVNTYGLGIHHANVLTPSAAQRSITQFDQALGVVASSRATIGAHVNRLGYTLNNLSTSSMNLVAAESRIRSVDMAAEFASFTSSYIRGNIGVSMLAHASLSASSVMSLIGW